MRNGDERDVIQDDIEGYYYTGEVRGPREGEFFTPTTGGGRVYRANVNYRTSYYILEQEAVPEPQLIEVDAKLEVSITVLGFELLPEDALELRNVLNGLPLEEIVLLRMVDAATPVPDEFDCDEDCYCTSAEECLRNDS